MAKRRDQSPADVDHDPTPPWAAAVLPPAFEGWAVVFQTNDSVSRFAATLGMAPLRLRRLIDAGHVFLVRGPELMRTRQLARHTGYSPAEIRALVRSGEITPVQRWRNGAPIFRSDQLAQKPGPDRWIDPFAAKNFRLKMLFAEITGRPRPHR